jgi:type IV fimbrial biogenesis protein FimT
LLGYLTMNASTVGRSKGVTLVELLVVIAILAISLTIAVPSVQELLRNNRVASQNNELVALITLAKSQAIRRNEDWQVELTSNGFSWVGNVRPADRTPEADEDAGCPERSGVVRCSNFQGVRLTGATTLTFNNRGFLELNPGDWDTVQLGLDHQGCTGARQARQIEVLPTGQISSQAVPCP